MELMKRENFTKLQEESGLRKKVICNAQESKEYEKLEKSNMPLPEGVYKLEGWDGSYYRIAKTDLTEEEMRDYLFLKQLQQTENIRIIKNCVLFFTVAYIISMIILILGLSGF